MKRKFQSITRAIGATLRDAIFWLILFALTGAGMLSAGVWLLYGLPWALLAGAGCSFLFSAVILRGVANG